MAKPPAVKIPIELDKSKAQKNMKEFVNDLVKRMTMTQIGLAAATKAWELLTASMAKAIQVGTEAVKLAGVQEKAERQLIRAQRMRGKFTDEQFESLERFNAEIQKQTKFSGAELLALQRMLTLQGAEEDQLKALTVASIGLTTVKDQGLAEAGTVVTKVLNGEIGALKEVNVIVKTSKEGLSKLVDMYQIAASETDTLGGQTNNLSKNYDDLLVALGRTLTQSPEVIQLLKDLNDVILNVATTINDNRQSIISFWDGMVAGARALADTLASPWFQAGINNLSSVVGMMLPAAQLAGQILATTGAGVGAIQAGIENMKPGATGGVPPMLARPDIPTGKTTKADQDKAKKAAEAQKKINDKAFGEFISNEVAQREHIKRLKREETEMLFEEARHRGAVFREAEDLHQQAREIAFQNDVAAFERRKELTRSFYQQLGSIALQGLGTMIGATVQAALEGEKSIGETLQAMFGTMLSQVGTMLISLGTATVIAALASGPVAFLWPLTGGPVAGAAAGLGLIAAGGGLMGLGGYITSSASETKRSISGTARQARAMAPSASAADSGRVGGTAQNRTHIYSITFNGALPGSERRTARAIREMLEKYGADFAPSYG